MNDWNYSYNIIFFNKAAVASILNGLTEREVRVTTVAGAMQVSWPENGSVFLTGPVELIARGTYTL